MEHRRRRICLSKVALLVLGLVSSITSTLGQSIQNVEISNIAEASRITEEELDWLASPLYNLTTAVEIPHRASANATSFVDDVERRRLENDGRYGWRKFSIVVGYANPATVPQRAQGVLAAGDIFSADEYVFNTKQNDNIGRMFQRGFLLPSATPLPPEEWETIWEFELQLRSSQPGKLMLQGPFVFPGTFEVNTYPDKQYVAITGGTGAFTSVYGVARIKPLNLLSAPPTLCYTFYLKLG